MGIVEKMTTKQILKLPDSCMILMGEMFISVKDFKEAHKAGIKHNFESNVTWENKTPQDILNDIQSIYEAVRNQK